MTGRRTAVLKALFVGGLLVAALAVAAPAGAHIAVDPEAVAVGSTSTVELVVEHGCEGDLDTTELEVTLPEGVTAAPGSVPGWTGTVTGSTIVWAGGPLPHDEEGRFPLTVTAPAEPTSVELPTLQRCGTAGIYRWIEVAGTGEDPGALDSPAPVLAVTVSGEVASDSSGGGSGSGGHHGGSGDAAAVSDTADDGTSPLALGLVAAGLVGGALVALALARRRRAATPEGALS